MNSPNALIVLIVLSAIAFIVFFLNTPRIIAWLEGWSNRKVVRVFVDDGEFDTPESAGYDLSHIKEREVSADVAH